MGNARGNTYSRRHEKLNPDKKHFWNFSWHEMGVYDLPAAINYVTEQTRQKVLYIGHSMGTTMFFVMASERPEVAQNITAMFGLAPVAFVNNVAWISKFMARTLRELEVILKFLKEFSYKSDIISSYQIKFH